MYISKIESEMAEGDVEYFWDEINVDFISDILAYEIGDDSFYPDDCEEFDWYGEDGLRWDSTADILSGPSGFEFNDMEMEIECMVSRLCGAWDDLVPYKDTCNSDEDLNESFDSFNSLQEVLRRPRVEVGMTYGLDYGMDGGDPVKPAVSILQHMIRNINEFERDPTPAYDAPGHKQAVKYGAPVSGYAEPAHDQIPAEKYGAPAEINGAPIHKPAVKCGTPDNKQVEISSAPAHVLTERCEHHVSRYAELANGHRPAVTYGVPNNRPFETYDAPAQIYSAPAHAPAERCDANVSGYTEPAYDHKPAKTYGAPAEKYGTLNNKPAERYGGHAHVNKLGFGYVRPMWLRELEVLKWMAQAQSSCRVPSGIG